MESISIVGFIAFLALTILGAWVHYLKVCRTGRHYGTLKDYLIADYPGRSIATGAALLGTAWTAATTGVSDYINPELVWTMIMQGKIHIPSVNIAAMAVATGYAFDSAINKGGHE